VCDACVGPRSHHAATGLPLATPSRVCVGDGGAAAPCERRGPEYVVGTAKVGSERKGFVI